MKIIAICIILIFLILPISVKAENPELSFQGDIGFIKLDSESSIIKFSNCNVSGYFNEIQYTNVAYLKINDSIIQNENKQIITKLNKSPSSSYIEKISFTNVALDLGLSNLSFKKGIQQNYDINGEIIYASSLSVNSESDNIIYSPKNYDITIDEQRIDSQVEIGIDENTNIKISDNIELQVTDPSGFYLESPNTNIINIELTNGDFRYKTHYFKLLNIDSLEITKSHKDNPNDLKAEIINNVFYVNGDVDCVELSNNIITKDELYYIIKDYGTIILAILNIVILAFLAVSTRNYAKTTKQIVEETRKERELNFIKNQLGQLYYPLDKEFTALQKCETFRASSFKSIIRPTYEHIYLAEDKLKKLLLKLFTTPSNNEIQEGCFENLANLIKEDIEKLESKLIDLK